MRKKTLLRITTETYSLRLLLKGQLKYMTENSFDVFVASAVDKHVQELESQENSKFYGLPLTRELTPFRDLLALYCTIRLIIKIRPDIVHTHSPKAGIVGMLAAYICRVPIKIHTVAGLPLMEANGIKRRILNFVEFVTYWCADWVLPNSVELKNVISDLDLCPNADKIKVLGRGSSNGIDLKYYDKSPEIVQQSITFREACNLKDEDIVLAFMGRLANYKGINELVEAFKILQDKHERIKLILIGASEDLNPLKSSTKDFIATNPSIISVGHQTDVRKFLASADIFVFPSYREGFPQSLMQACAMELPSVASDINGCNEIIHNNINGLLVKPKSVTDIVDACSLLITNSDLRKSMGLIARKHVSENFEQQKLWKIIHNFYLSTLESARQ
jgi:glycosyltransferase involved in cell wall biosynthesis